MWLYDGCGGGRGAKERPEAGAVVQKSVGFTVMDVPVLLSDKFLHSKEPDQNAPQIQFIFRVWDIPVVQQRRLRTVQPVQKTDDSTVLVQLWGGVVFEAAAWGGGRLLFFQVGGRGSSHR